MSAKQLGQRGDGGGSTRDAAEEEVTGDLVLPGWLLQNGDVAIGISRVGVRCAQHQDLRMTIALNTLRPMPTAALHKYRCRIRALGRRGAIFVECRGRHRPQRVERYRHAEVLMLGAA